MQAEQQSERERFEDWHCGMYAGLQREIAWAAWKARAALSHPSPQGCPVPYDVALNIAGPFNACMFRQHCRAMLAVSPPPPEQGSKG